MSDFIRVNNYLYNLDKVAIIELSEIRYAGSGANETYPIVKLGFEKDTITIDCKNGADNLTKYLQKKYPNLAQKQ